MPDYVTGEGIPDLLYLLTHLSMKHLTHKLAFVEECESSVLEVKAIPGLGTTIDIILTQGRLFEVCLQQVGN